MIAQASITTNRGSILKAFCRSASKPQSWTSCCWACSIVHKTCDQNLARKAFRPGSKQSYWQNWVKRFEDDFREVRPPTPIQNAKNSDRPKIHWCARRFSFCKAGYPSCNYLSRPFTSFFCPPEHVTEVLKGGNWLSLQVFESHSIKSMRGGFLLQTYGTRSIWGVIGSCSM